jgi:hypothetical protein
MIQIKEKLIHYYEIDLDNCNMSQEDWVDELAKAMSDPNYLDKFNKEYKQYLNTINV